MFREMAIGNDSLTYNGGRYMGFIVESFEFAPFGGCYIVNGFTEQFNSLDGVREFIDNHITEGAKKGIKDVRTDI